MDLKSNIQLLFLVRDEIYNMDNHHQIQKHDKIFKFYRSYCGECRELIESYKIKNHKMRNFYRYFAMRRKIR